MKVKVDADGYCRQCNTYVDCDHARARRKMKCAQARLNRAAVAWAKSNCNEAFAENYDPKGLYCVEVHLARAVRAFQKASGK